MKKSKRIAGGFLALCLTVSLCACGGEQSEGTVKVSGERAEAIAAEPKEISFIVPGYDGSDPESDYTKAIQELEKSYGKKVTVLTTVGDQTWNQKVAAQVAAGDPIDVFFVNVGQYLSMYQKGYMKAVDEYIDLSNEWHHKSVMDDYMKFDGKYYAGCVSATPYVMFYNRDILSNNGFDPDEPQKLYEQGEWSWSKFVELARACTDADEGITGLENMYDEVFQATNAASAVKYADNRYELTIMTDAMRSTLEMVQDIFYTNVICGNGYVTGQNKFLKGKAAFHGAYAYEDAAFIALKERGTVNIDFGVTAFPKGPQNTENVHFGDTTGFAIANGSKAPYTAGMLIDLIGKYATETSQKAQSTLPAGRQEFYDTLAKDIFIPRYTDGILQEGNGAFYLLYYVRQGDDINSCRATYQTEYQKMVDDANALLK